MFFGDAICEHLVGCYICTWILLIAFEVQYIVEVNKQLKEIEIELKKL